MSRFSYLVGRFSGVHAWPVLGVPRGLRGDFTAALEWGRRGKTLKESSGADTEYEIRHQLALAERDAGNPEIALETFLAGREMSMVLDPEELEIERGGAYYGNVGRCLHFMGQIEGALVCYQKSALIIERAPKHQHVRNQGYIRMWIGELLAARNEFRLAEAFFQAAYIKWSHLSPSKAHVASTRVQELREHLSSVRPLAENEAERICEDWILGRDIDVQQENQT
jgi:tetratricopeptide (TPR) repeat protein